MFSKSLRYLILFLSVFSSLRAQSVTIDPPAPPAYSEERPPYVFFKNIEISPRDSGSYDVKITLQDALPSTFPKGRGVHFTMSFDFAEIHPEKSLPENHIPNFHADLNISFDRGIGETKFRTYAAPLEYRKREWKFQIANFMARKDTISFSVRSPFFALHLPSRVVFRSNFMKATSPTQSSGSVSHETLPISPDLPEAGATQ